MRRTTVLLVVAGLAIGAADAAFAQVPSLLRTAEAEGFELQNGNGRAVVTGRGALLVTVRTGWIRVVDLPGGGRPNLSDTCRRRSHRVSQTTRELRGTNVGCIVWSGPNGGRWQLIARGRRIDASGNVRGSLTLDGVDTGPRGRYQIADRPWRRWPLQAHTYGLRRT